MKKLHLPCLFTLLLLSFSISLKSQSSLWGVTTAGGTNGAGTIFGVSTGSTTFSSQFNMTDYSGAGSTNMFSKLLEVNGKLYGTTTTGGSNAIGVIFSYDPVANTYTPLASFTGSTGAVNGSQPNSGLMLASNGKLYGMTRQGGAGNIGAIFSYDIASNTYSLLASFTGTSGAVPGSQPLGGLMQASDGKLYGLTSLGGSSNVGTLFQLDPSSNTYSLMLSFTGTTGSFPGSSPQACTLLEGNTNKLHGVLLSGGTSNNGVLFEYNFSTSTYSALMNFTTAATGGQPFCSLIKASNGKLYGTTNTGGSNGTTGVIFEYDLSSSTFAKDADMTSGTSGTGINFRCGLLQATNGKLYGVTRAGGANSVGTLVEYDYSTSTLTKDFDFATSTGGTPQSPLVQFSVNSKLYGMTTTGGSTNLGGVIYEYDISSSTYTEKIDLGLSFGGQPNGGLVMSLVNNKLYGMATQGSSVNVGAGGAIYEYDYTNNTYVKKVDLTAANGRFPYGNLAQTSNGNLYGLMSSGGTSSLGTIIQYIPATTSYSKMMDFNGTNGSTPYGSMVLASNGNFYGLTSAGGANSAGVLFEYNPSTNAYVDKHDFTGTDGANPFGSLFIASNGKAYGLTSSGGANGFGVLFEYNITTGTYTKDFDFASSTGSNPFGSLVQGNNGSLYGLTRNGGANGIGVIFEYNITSSAYTDKVNLFPTYGGSPYGSLIKAANGSLYGLTTTGGANGIGAFFEFNPATSVYTDKMDLSASTGALPGFTQLMEICNFPASASAISATSAICQSDPTIQNFSISSISNALSYTWTIPSGASITSGSTTNNMSVNLSGVAAGVYTITAGGVNVCGTGTLSSRTITINTLPSISAPGATICSGSSATITPSGASVYVFQGGSAIVSPTTTASYTVSGTDANGCTAASPATVVITVNTSPAISVSSGSICTGDSFSLSPTGASNYSVNGTAGGLLVSPSTTTTYSITGTGANGCATPSMALATVTVNIIPSIGASSGSICSGSSFSISPTGAGAYSITGTLFLVNPTVTTTYSVTGTSTAGCAASNTAVVTVSVYATPTLAVNSGSICSSNSFTIVPSGNASSYNITGNNFTVSPAGTTFYTVTGTSSVGCVSGSAVSTVVVNTTPTLTANSGSICSGKIYTITTNSGGVPILSYSLISGSGSATLSGSNYFVNPTVTAGYSIAATSTAGCLSNQVVSNVTVNTTPTITASSGSICSGNVYTITTTSGGIGVNSYTVSGTYTLSGNNLLVNPASSTIYSIAATSTAGCSSGTVNSTVFVNNTPILSAASGSICSGNTYTITVSPSVGILSYGITGSNVVSASANLFFVDPTSPTVYSIVATSTANCTSAQITPTVGIYASPVITVNSGSMCAGSSFNILPGGANTYTIAGGNFTVSPSTSTNYTVAGSSTAGCISNVVTSSVIVNALPTISISTASSVCAGETATLIASGGVTYNWVPNPSGATLTVVPTANTTYTVIGTDANGCFNLATASITVNTLPTINAPSGAVCPGDSFTLMPTGAVTYTYSSGSNVVTPSSTSSYSITGTDINGCISALAAVATVTVATTLPVTISGPGSVCSGGYVVLTAGGASTYSWNTGAATMTDTVSPTTSTIYTVTGSSGSCSNTATFSVTALPLPNVQVSTSAPVICNGETAVLTASGALTYTWVNTSQNTSTIAVSPAANTAYTLMGVDANNCANAGTLVQGVDACLGLASNKADISFNVYPNPNNGEFNIESPKAISVIVLNTLGEVVLTQQLEEGKNTINIGRQAKGLYFIQATNNKQFKAVRIAVQ